MSSNQETYRMLILLEEAIEDQIDVPGQENVKTSHEYLDELKLPFNVDELDELNSWFDKFDEQICIPNEGHIKYEITSDGMIVLMLDKSIENVFQKIKDFIKDN